MAKTLKVSETAVSKLVALVEAAEAWWAAKAFTADLRAATWAPIPTISPTDKRLLKAIEVIECSAGIKILRDSIGKRAGKKTPSRAKESRDGEGK